MTATTLTVTCHDTICGTADVRPKSLFRPSKTHSPLAIAPPSSRHPVFKPSCLEYHPWVPSHKAPSPALYA